MICLSKLVFYQPEDVLQEGEYDDSGKLYASLQIEANQADQFFDEYNNKIEAKYSLWQANFHHELVGLKKEVSNRQLSVELAMNIQ